jgi:ABC-type multidrug transport system ATPase subunit
MEGRTVFWSSHELDEVQRLADRVAIIKHGRLIATETGAVEVESEQGAADRRRGERDIGHAAGHAAGRAGALGQRPPQQPL